MKRIGTYLGCLWPCIAFLLIQIAVSAVTAISIILVLMASPTDLAWKERIKEIGEWIDGPGTVLINVVATFATAIAGYTWYHIRYHNTKDYKLREVARTKDYIYLVVLGFVAFFGADIVFFLYSFLFPKAIEYYEDVVNLSGLGTNLYMIAAAIFLAPIGEECFYRGLILRKAEVCMPFFAANLFQAFLFGAMHMNLVQSSYAFLLGLILGYVRYQYDSVRMSILLHMFFNIFGQLLPFLLPEMSDSIYIGMVLISILIIAVILWNISKLEIPKKTVPELIYSDEPSGNWKKDEGNNQDSWTTLHK